MLSVVTGFQEGLGFKNLISGCIIACPNHVAVYSKGRVSWGRRVMPLGHRAMALKYRATRLRASAPAHFPILTVDCLPHTLAPCSPAPGQFPLQCHPCTRCTMACVVWSSLPCSTKIRSSTFLPETVTNSSDTHAKSPATRANR